VKGAWRYKNQGLQEMAFGSLKGRIVLSSEVILHTIPLEEGVKANLLKELYKIL
jgi:hypothetical protein